MSLTPNQFTNASIAGIEVETDYATLCAATVAPGIAALRALLNAEGADEGDTERQMLAGITPTGRDMLIAHLDALDAVVGTYVPA